MDNLDIEIINILIKNPKIPYLEIAKSLNVSDSTIHIRIKNMIREKIIIGSGLNVDYEKLGFPVTSFIQIRVGDLRYFRDTYEMISHICGILEMHALSGYYNILIKLISKSLKDLNEIILNEISGIDHVDDIKYSISLNNSIYKKMNF